MPIPAADSAALSMSGPCAPWEPIWCCNLPTGASAVTGAAVQAATEVLWNLSGQRFGLCTVTLRPCRRDCFGGAWPTSGLMPEWAGGGRWPYPALVGGAWVNLGCGSCAGSCSCGALEEALLPAPVHDVFEVRVDGVGLATSAYRVDNNRVLVRVDGGVWSRCQNLALADTEPGTWSVTARIGEDVPTVGRQAVGELACEMARACLGEDCLLPSNVQQLVRQGVSISFPDSQTVVDRLYFGGLFLHAYNPHKLTGRARVYDVDGPGFRLAGV